MKEYDKIKYKGLDWYVLDTNEETTRLLLKDVISEEKIKEYADDEFMIDDYEVRHQDNIRNFDWEKSYIKNVILPAFKEDLEIDGEVDLLTVEEANELPDNIRTNCSCYWTKTAYSSDATLVFAVASGGCVYYSIVYNTNGVRPVLNISSTQFLSEDARGTLATEKIEKLEPCEISSASHFDNESTFNVKNK